MSEKVNELKRIYGLLKNPKSADDATESSRAYTRGWLEGRAFEITTDMDQHPEFWEGRPCNCYECQDAVADYTG